MHASSFGLEMNARNQYFARENNFQFLDTTNFVIKKSKETILHGPLDWRHFNYVGYKNVSNYIIENI